MHNHYLLDAFYEKRVVAALAQFHLNVHQLRPFDLIRASCCCCTAATTTAAIVVLVQKSSVAVKNGAVILFLQSS